MVGHLGDAKITVFGGVRALPFERAHPPAPTAGGIERPTAARKVRAAEESPDCFGYGRETTTGCVSYDGSSADVSSACASRSFCAYASFPNPFDLPGRDATSWSLAPASPPPAPAPALSVPCSA